MKSIQYDSEGDILSVFFVESKSSTQAGVELSDNIILYLDPAAEKPLALILSSYQAMLHAHENSPIVLDGLGQLPPPLQTTILKLLRREPLRSFLQLLDAPATDLPTGRLPHVFVPAVLQSVAAD
jgi:hypothetical protein